MAPGGVYWSGNGWTGQPLIAEWPKETRQVMNMYDWAKQQETLVEVVYPSMDGYVYFYELQTGKATRIDLSRTPERLIFLSTGFILDSFY